MREAVLVDLPRDWGPEIEAQVFTEERGYGFGRHRRPERVFEPLSHIMCAGRQHHSFHHISSSTVRL